jgi:DNA repair exonuclease SbcCD ATPase subunit
MADNKIEIKVNADTTNASTGLSRVQQQLKGFSTIASSAMNAIGKAMSFLSRLNWVYASIQLIIEGFRNLHKWINESANAARELADRLANESIETAIAHAAEQYKRLNKEIAEANRLEKERNAILDKRRGGERDIEDANSLLEKEREISALDPASENYAEDKAAIERKYARKDAETKFAREQEDSRIEVRRLYEEARRKDAEANKLQKNADKHWRASDQYNELRIVYATGWRRNTEGAAEKAEEYSKKSYAEYDEAKKIEAAAEELRKAAESLRRQGGELMGGSPGARARRDATLQRIKNDERAADAQKAKAEKEAREKQEAAASAQAEEERRLAEREEAKKTNEKRTSLNEKRTSLIGELEPFARNAANADLVSSNRLTAMGLGSGVSGGSSVANDVKRIIDLLQEEIKATKENKPTDTTSIATFAE